MEFVTKYVADNARVFFVSLGPCVAQTRELNGTNVWQSRLLGKAETFACCLAALQKEAEASVRVRFSLPGVGGFSATADRSGIVRGRIEEPEQTGMLEVSLSLPLRGNYTGIIEGDDMEQMMRDYFARSLQIAADFKVFCRNREYFCVLVEQLPGEAADLSAIAAAACRDLPDGRIPEGFELLETREVSFGCTCSRGALLRLVSGLSEEERAELAQDGKIVTFCNSCGKKYTFEL